MSSGPVRCKEYTSHKVMNTHLLASNMDSLRNMEDWEIPVSEIQDYTYKLVSTIAIMEGSPLIATS